MLDHDRSQDALAMLPSREAIDIAANFVYDYMQSTPQYRWPLLEKRLGCQVTIKHENTTPTGAFKIRGGLVYMAGLDKTASRVLAAVGLPLPELDSSKDLACVIAATRGNHGQSVAIAAGRYGLRSVIVVPEGNSLEKNAAMTAQGAELVVRGQDFQSAYEYAIQQARGNGWHLVPSVHPLLVAGVASYGRELFANSPAIDRLYVPIGLGSGVCAMLAARDAYSPKTEIIGVVSKGAPAYLLSYQQGKVVPTASASTIADGIACRSPNADVVEAINRKIDDIISVDDDAICAAMRAYFEDCHSLTEGAGAAALAGLMCDPRPRAGKHCAAIATGSNIDRQAFAAIIAADQDGA